MTSVELRTRARQLPEQDSRRIAALDMLMEADEFTKRANALIAGAERILNERPAKSGRMRLETSVNGA
jgi:hypothetical protein